MAAPPPTLSGIMLLFSIQCSHFPRRSLFAVAFQFPLTLSFPYQLMVSNVPYQGSLFNVCRAVRHSPFAAPFAVAFQCPLTLSIYMYIDSGIVWSRILFFRGEGGHDKILHWHDHFLRDTMKQYRICPGECVYLTRNASPITWAISFKPELRSLLCFIGLAS